MLVLSRRCGDELYIDDRIKIKVVRVGPKTVRLGIEAPPELRIMRGELRRLIDRPLSDEAVVIAAFGNTVQ